MTPSLEAEKLSVSFLFFYSLKRKKVFLNILPQTFFLTTNFH